ncbi:MAG: DUF2017 domain-containing protein [Bifidobacteriaceae bacterium]|jgi:hypothetical protein|nr:DUF2017 domain-containing protein [Bifidobacteriaceae bacterium]
MQLFSLVEERFVAQLDPAERAVLAAVANEVQSMIKGETPPSFEVLPTLTRLFPPASMSDPQVAREFVDLTGKSMRETKEQRLGRLAARLSAGTVHLDAEQAQESVAAMNDIRLALAEMLGIETADDVERVTESLAQTDEPAEPNDVFGELYMVFTALQDSLVAALASAAP